jgi:hypothetical protein
VSNLKLKKQAAQDKRKREARRQQRSDKEDVLLIVAHAERNMQRWLKYQEGQ